MRYRPTQRGFTLIELLIVIAIIGVIAAILIPNFLDSLQKTKQKRTMADIRTAGTAWFSWMSDQYGGAAAAGADQNLYTMPPADFGGFEAVRDELVPAYIQQLPETDAWQNPLVYCGQAPQDMLVVANAMAIGSPGRDGEGGEAVCGAQVAVGGFTPTDYDQDVVWADGYFIRYPERPPHEE